MIRPVMVIEDCSALGQISMVAATTVLQAAGITTALLPSTLLSTQTEEFGVPAQLPTDQWQWSAYNHWKKEQVDFAGIIVGYLGNENRLNVARQILKAEQTTLKIVDPVMADEGHLYPGLNVNYPQIMRKICQYADVITPNWTELCLLGGLEVTAPSEVVFHKAIRRLRHDGINGAVVVTGVVKDQQIGYWLLLKDRLKFIPFNYFPGHFYGTGDLFAALLYIYLQTEHDLMMAVKSAGNALAIAVEETSHLGAHDRQFGMKLQRLLAYLA